MPKSDDVIDNSVPKFDDDFESISKLIARVDNDFESIARLERNFFIHTLVINALCSVVAVLCAHWVLSSKGTA